MVLALEALPAKHGDCLLLHYGDDEEPELVVIDGGPAGVYAAALRPRLEALRRARAIDPDDPLPIRLLMVSHIDDDHINGLLDFTDALIAHTGPREFVIDSLWHNSFDDVIGQDIAAGGQTAQAVVASALPELRLPAGRRHEAAVLASVPQGQRLRDNAARLNLTPVNVPFDGLVRADGSGPFEFDDGLELHVIAPSVQRLAGLQKAWDKHLRQHANRKDAVIAAYRDRSPFNLSSIVVLVSFGGTRMLLTGDARGDHILDGLREAGLLANGPFHVDVLKLPHHGSNRNVTVDFFRQIPADHYVASGDGGHGNPEPETFRMIAEARGSAVYTLHLTYPVEAFREDYPKQDLLDCLADLRRTNANLNVRFPEHAQRSLTINPL